MLTFNILLFDDFETLDIFGPIEIFGRNKEHQLHYYSMSGGLITSAQGTPILTEPITNIDTQGILVVPGGMGTRILVNDKLFLQSLTVLAEQATYCLSICTGSTFLPNNHRSLLIKHYSYSLLSTNNLGGTT